MNKIGLLICSATLALGCSGKSAFSESDRAMIGSEPKAGPMRVFMIDNPDDSLVLRGCARKLTGKDIASPYFATLSKRMLATVTDPANDGVGIAAPQVGISVRLIAVQRFDKEGEPFEIYANPSFKVEDLVFVVGPEGCLSIAGRRENVSRFHTISLSYDDLRNPGKRITEQISGYTAVIFQHEIDHLEGRLFIDPPNMQTIMEATQPPSIR